MDVDRKTSKRSGAKEQPPKERNRRAERKPSRTMPKGRASPPAVRRDTKQALLVDLLKRKKGATIEAIVETLGWQPHTVRAALTRLRQLGFQIERVREDGVSRYCIVEDRKAA